MIPAVQIEAAQLRGYLHIEGAKVAFEADVSDRSNIAATFGELPAGTTDWQAFQVLEQFVAQNFGGSNGGNPEM